MNRKLITGAVVFVAFVLVTTGVLALSSSKSPGNELFTSPVDVGKSLELHFEDYHIKLIAWDNEEMKIKESQFHTECRKGHIEISFDENILTVKSEEDPINSFSQWIGTSTYQSQLWLSLLQFDKYFEYAHEVWDQCYVDFYIYLPKGIKVNTYCSGVINPPGDIDFTNNWSDAE